MNKLTITSLKHRENLIKELSEFYYPRYKITWKLKDYGTNEICIGTIIRIKHNKIWYDIPLIDWYRVIDDAQPSDYFNMYKIFLDKAYKIMHLYIVDPDYEFKSIFQISEKERLKELIT